MCSFKRKNNPHECRSIGGCSHFPHDFEGHMDFIIFIITRFIVISHPRRSGQERVGFRPPYLQLCGNFHRMTLEEIGVVRFNRPI